MELVQKLLVNKTRNSYLQFIRYGLVATIALAVDFGGLVFLVEVLHMHYLIAATISFTAGLLVNYYLSRMWVFHSSKLESSHKEFIIFAIIGVAGLIITDVLLWLLTDVAGFYYMISKAIVTIIVYFWNFGLRKKLLFN